MKKFLLIAFLLSPPAFAVTIEQPLQDAMQEQQARAIFYELKCVVCEGQALAESDATLARQMRAEVREMVSTGKTEQEILDIFASRYGIQVLMDPPFETATLFLWLAPVLLILTGALIMTRVMK